ncbi:hypothetical protein [Bdellovibrio sp. HCB-162]|uniref:hypothetical protein n=1 Tax=Bdellovibrio sp. HCB-162 TaxID=3394234 RepID=UPI0039BD44D9
MNSVLECPICLKLVKKFKSGCHVIPRWAMRMTKDGEGSYASLHLENIDEPKAFREQSDLICDFWCETCENRFRDDDANGARFFKNRMYIVHEMQPDPKTGNMGVEIHDPRALDDLRSFIVSLLIRYEVYGRNVPRKSPLGNRFSFYAKAYLDRELDGENAALMLFRNVILGESHSSSVKTRFGTRNCVRIIFCGYDVFLISDSRGPQVNDLSSLITDREIVIPIYGGAQLPQVSELIQKIRCAGPLPKKRAR